MLTFERWAERLAGADFAPAYGQVTSIASHLIEADGPAGTIGQLCRLVNSRHAELLAEIVAVERGRVLLSPLGSIDGVLLGDRVVLASTKRGVAVGDAFAGRAVDALGLPIDDRPRIAGDRYWSLHGDLPSPLDLLRGLWQ